MRLLIVDDSSVIRSRIGRIQAAGAGRFEIIGSASNGSEALELFKKHRPEAVTMDLTMPEMDGISCIEEMVKIDSSVRILVISAISDKETGMDALLRGARGFLFKPFNDAELLNALEALAAQ